MKNNQNINRKMFMRKNTDPELKEKCVRIIQSRFKRAPAGVVREADRRVLRSGKLYHMVLPAFLGRKYFMRRKEKTDFKSKEFSSISLKIFIGSSQYLN